MTGRLVYIRPQAWRQVWDLNDHQLLGKIFSNHLVIGCWGLLGEAVHKESLGQAGLPWWSVIERYQRVCRANSWSLQKRSAAARSFGRPLTPSHVANLSVYLRTCGLQKLHVKHILIENPSHISGFLLILWFSLCSQLLPLRAGASSRGAHFSIFPQRHWIIFGGDDFHLSTSANSLRGLI